MIISKVAVSVQWDLSLILGLSLDAQIFFGVISLMTNPLCNLYRFYAKQFYFLMAPIVTKRLFKPVDMKVKSLESVKNHITKYEILKMFNIPKSTFFMIKKN